MPREILRTCFILLLTLMAAEGLAADPLGTAFTYQGELIEAGKPLTGSYDFRFELYDAASDGAQVGPTLDIADVSVLRGRFNVELDFGNVFDNFAIMVGGGNACGWRGSLQCPGPSPADDAGTGCTF